MCADIALISRALPHFSVQEDLHQLCPDLDPGKQHVISSLLEQLVFLGLWADDALLLIGLIADNRLNGIRRFGLPKALQTARLKRLGLLLV